MLNIVIHIKQKHDTIKGNESDVGNIDFELRLKEVTNSYVLHCFELQKVHIFATTCPIEMEFESKCSIFTGQVIYIEKIKIEYCRHVTQEAFVFLQHCDVVIQLYHLYNLSA